MFLSTLIWRGYSRFLAEPISVATKFEALDPERQRREMAARLFKQIRHFGSRADALPEWREAARISDPDELWRIWPSLPVVTKATLNERFEPAEMQRRFNLKGRVSSTGGSTGESTRFFLDTAMLRVARASHLYSQLEMGWRPGMPTIIVWGSDRDIGKQMSRGRALMHHFYGHYLIPGFVVTDEAVRNVHRIVCGKGPVAIYGFSSLLEIVAERSLAMGLKAETGQVKVAWSGAEMLYERQIELFRKVFGVPILNRYGGRELSATAFQSRPNGPLRVIRPWLFVEIVNSDGRPSAPGQVGRLLLTSTATRGTPFLRYEVGDLAAFEDSGRNESGIHSIGTLHGRSAGSLRLKDGRVVSSLFWNHLLKDYPEIQQFQVRVSREDKIALIFTGREFSRARSAQLLSIVQPMMGDHVVSLERVDEIARTSQGKLMQVVKE